MTALAQSNGGHRGIYARNEQPDGPIEKPRALLQCLLREVERGDQLSDAEARRNVEVAVQVRDSGKSDRDRLWAVRLLEAMRDRGYNIAMYLDKQERPQQPSTVNNIQNNLTLEVPAPHVRRRGERVIE